MTRNYYLNADAAIVMYDVTQRDTFEEVSYWLSDIKQNIGPDQPIVYAIVGNKIDLAD